jgi:hypothetical protein
VSGNIYENSKFKIRNLKQIQNSKSEIQKLRIKVSSQDPLIRSAVLEFLILGFGFVLDLEF